MSLSKEEELIGCLWIIGAVLCFGFGYRWWGYAFAVKGGIDQFTSIRYAIKGGMREEWKRRQEARKP